MKSLTAILASSTQLVSWWTSFRELAPDWAMHAEGLPVLTLEEMRAKGFLKNGQERFTAGAADLEGEWIWFKYDPPDSRLLAHEVLHAVTGLGDFEVPGLDVVFARAVERRDRPLFGWLRAWIEAAMTWSIADLEKRLGMPIEKAYQAAGSIPSWDAHMGYGATKERVEPRQCLVLLFEGIQYEDTVWPALARRVWPDSPASFPKSSEA